MHALGERTILRRHLRDPVEDRLQPVGLLGALLALGAQFGGARSFIAARSSALKPSDSDLGFFAGILGLPFDPRGLGGMPAYLETLNATTPWRFSIPDRIVSQPRRSGSGPHH
jgi:hypothetical protein